MLKAGLLAVGLLLIAAPAAWASTFTVDNTGDDNGTGACTALGAADCTLRSAITNANTAGADAIDFAPAVSDGTVANSTILLDVGANGALPSIGADTTLDGGNCGTATAPRPCVGLDGGGTGGAALHISAVNVTVRGLAISNAGTGVLVDSATDNVKGNWFGIKLDGTTEGALVNGVELLDDQADSNTIGGTTAADRNVFSRTTAAAVYMASGPDNNVVEGNYFGTRPDGSIAGPGKIGYGITIGGTTPVTTANQAIGNTIGGTETLGTPAVCDGACNLIDNATNNGIDLNFFGDPLPAQNTTIAGNFIGLGVDGGSDGGNGEIGVNVGASTTTTVGGPPSSDMRNYIDGNDNGGVDIAGTGNTGAKVQNNYIGATPGGAAPVPNALGSGLLGLVTRAGNTSAIITSNRFEQNPVDLKGNSSQFRGNALLGADGSSNSALQIEGDSNQVGVGGPMGPMPAQANTIGNVGPGTSAPAIDVFGGADSNLIKGNSVGVDPANGNPLPIAGTAIEIGAHGGASTGNVVGAPSSDTSTVAENVISNAGGDAISLATDGSDNNHILRNTGRGNGTTSNDLFVDLLAPDGPGNNTDTGPNQGVQPPLVNPPSTTGVSGTSLEAATTPVYVFSTFSGRGDVKAYLGSTTVDAMGNWTFNYPIALGNGVCVTALQDATGKGSSELAVPTPIGGGACDVAPPETTITSGPADGDTIKTDTATFEFSAADANSPSTFECSLDGGPFTGCLTPKNLVQLGDGTHTFEVRAIDPAGNVDQSPESRTFTVDTSTPASGGGAPADTTPPQTKIGKVKVKGTTATVTFSGTDETARLASASAAGVSFKCKLDKGKFKACSSPKRFRHLRAGRHKVTIEAIDAAGNVDPTPAKKKFTV